MAQSQFTFEHIRSLLLVMLGLMYTSTIAEPTNRSDCKTLQRLITAMEALHYSPIEFTDKQSSAIFTNFLNELDPYQLYLTTTDRDVLFLYQYKLDDEILAGSCNFIDKVVDRYRIGLERAKGLITEIAQTPFDLNEIDTLYYLPAYTIEENTRQQMKIRWQKWLKNKVFSRLFSPSVTNPKPYELAIETIMKEEEAIRKAICIKELKMLDEKMKSLAAASNAVTDIFFNSITHQYDPHSDFFSISDKEIFETMLSDENLSFGLEVVENEAGNLEIAALVPGGPAWKSNELHKGDILQQLQIKGGQAYDLTLLTIEKLQEIFSEIGKEEVVLTVKKISGQLKSITLVKEVISNDENAINSFILDGEQKIGYISLPSFYTELENENM